MFLRYKALKKKIKAIPSQSTSNCVAEPVQDCADHDRSSAEEKTGAAKLYPEEMAFIAALNEDLHNFNSFFIEKEEDAVMKLQYMSDQLKLHMTPKTHSSSAEINELQGQLVNFHGELVLILHWSLINYSALVKILKKHDKRTGLLLRAPYIANVLKQPFASTSVMSRLVKKAEDLVETASKMHPEAIIVKTDEEKADCANASDEECSTMTAAETEPVLVKVKRTEHVLEMWSTLAKGASTPSTILPIDDAVQRVAPEGIRHHAGFVAPGPEQGMIARKCEGRPDQILEHYSCMPPLKRSRPAPAN